MNQQGVRHLISLRDLDRTDVDRIVERAAWHADGGDPGGSLTGRIVGTYFTLPSTRTRTSFSAGALRLGAQVIGYGPGDLQLHTGESLPDTARVLGGMLDVLVCRTPDDPRDLITLAAQDRMAVVNAMSLHEHPTQALADLLTMYQHFGRIDGLDVLYLGEGNSTAVALCLALPMFAGTRLHVRTPAGHGVSDDILLAANAAGTVEQRHDMAELPAAVDVVYTTQWHTTGTATRPDGWQDHFAPFRVTAELLDRFPSAVFMHDLPARRGEEVESQVIDGPRSIVFTQAANKLYSAMAALEWCLSVKS
jgi:ornithine carbamoyltransferase